MSPSRSSPGLLISGRTSPDPPDVRGRTVLSPGLLSPRPRYCHVIKDKRKTMKRSRRILKEKLLKILF